MKRIVPSLVMILGSLLTPHLPSWAEHPVQTPGELAVGYWGNEHLSLRHWMSSTMALDAGIGFQFASNANRFDLQLGVPIILRSYPSLLVEARPGFELSSRQNVTTDITIQIALLAEWFLPGTDNRLSLSGGPNFGILISTPSAGGSSTTLGTGSTNLILGGLHFYF